MPVTPVGELHSTEHECTVQLQHAYFLKFARYAATSFLSPQKKKKTRKKNTSPKEKSGTASREGAKP
jgi:hypothetical protein